ncbi:MAG: molybdopterin-dependent oxidoreductase [Acidimicrobiales bacterium]
MNRGCPPPRRRRPWSTLASWTRWSRWTLRTLAERYQSPLHDTRNAAWLGLALGVSFTVCFLTGLWSHLAQDPPGWFTYPARPAGLYRITQGLHVVSGMASVPLLLAKLWVVHPRLVQWPPARSALHAVERVTLVPLVGGGLFMLLSGAANVARWYPWTFFFPRAHFWVAWITIGALAVHVGAKAAAARDALRRSGRPDAAAARPGAGPHVVEGGPALEVVRPQGQAVAPMLASSEATPRDRRAFLGGVAVASGALAVATAGGTVSPLSAVSVLAQRRPSLGPQGIPVNKSAAGADVLETARDPGYRLVVDGAVSRRIELSLAELRALPQRSAELPIACVEGWSASAEWRGVPVRDLLDLAGIDDRADATAIVESLQPRGRYRRSELNPGQIADHDTLLAVEVNGDPLHIDHGFPVRLVGPNRPGVLQTKWVSRLLVR